MSYLYIGVRVVGYMIRYILVPVLIAAAPVHCDTGGAALLELLPPWSIIDSSGVPPGLLLSEKVMRCGMFRALGSCRLRGHLGRAGARGPLLAYLFC